MHRTFAIFLGLGLLGLSVGFAAPQTARAQTDAEAEIISIDAQNFPQVSALMDVYDANGEFMAGLQPGDLTASRTAPFVSKATGVQMAKAQTNLTIQATT